MSYHWTEKGTAVLEHLVEELLFDIVDGGPVSRLVAVSVVPGTMLVEVGWVEGRPGGAHQRLVVDHQGQFLHGDNANKTKTNPRLVLKWISSTHTFTCTYVMLVECVVRLKFSVTIVW